VPLVALSQLGVLLFMFVVGLRLDLGVLRGRARAAVATSHASIALPFALGAALAPLLPPRLIGPDATPLGFTLFLGAAMSVTAFPVLARILTERGLLGTKLGAVAIASAAVDDVTAWCILAAVVAVVRAGSALAPLLTTLIAVAMFTAFVAFAARPLLVRLERHRLARGAPVTAELVSAVVLFALLSALATELLGVHALFGAFVAGAAVPRDSGLAAAVADRTEDVVAAVLLPIFFALTGLRTSVALLGDASLWGWCLVVIAVAVAGKLGGSAVAARLSGMEWRDALGVGVLMNTRGLMELVILNVGLDIGVISPALYTMMVIMALVTTMMTTPLLQALRQSAPAAGMQPAESGGR
jgi:Kef-type K+ transport system membrane component KefB